MDLDPEVEEALSRAEALMVGHPSDEEPEELPALPSPKADFADVGEPVAAPPKLPKAPEPVRLRAPTPPSAAPVKDAGPVDWKALKEGLDRAQLGAKSSRDAEHLFENVSLGGYKTDPGRFQAQIDAARQPLELAKEKQGFEARALAQDAQKSKLGADAANRDPNSLQSQKARNSLKAFFGDSVKLPEGFDEWSAADVKAFADSGTLARIEANRAAAADREAKAKTAAQHAEEAKVRQAAADKLAADRFEESKRHNHQTEGAMWQAAGRAEKKAAEGHPLSTTALNDLADFEVADRSLAQLQKDFGQLGMSGPLAKASGAVSEGLGLTSTDAAVYLNKAKQAQQVVGKILEGGKLAAGDEAKYRSLIPQPGDSPQLLQSKISGLRQFLGDMKQGRIKVYGEGGYKVPASEQGGGVVKMRFPDGSTHDVPADKVEKAKLKGGLVTDG